MKKAAILIMALSITGMASAQVRVSMPTTPEKQTVPYDSLLNYIGDIGHPEKIRGYVGQEFYFIPREESFRKYKLYDFSTKSTDRYEGMGYDDLAGKTMRVVDVNLGGRHKYDRDINMTLVNKVTGDTIYYKYSTSAHKFPFLVLGYKEKFEKENKGKTFLYKGVSRTDFSDFNTGKSVLLNPGDQWKFDEIIIVPKLTDQDNVKYLFSNAKGEQLAVDKEWMVSKAVIDKQARLCGKRLCDIALKREIAVGMTKELVIIAWGEPDNINKTSYNEQWVYGDAAQQCVYFKGGKVTSWN